MTRQETRLEALIWEAVADHLSEISGSNKTAQVKEMLAWRLRIDAERIEVQDEWTVAISGVTEDEFEEYGPLAMRLGLVLASPSTEE